MIPPISLYLVASSLSQSSHQGIESATLDDNDIFDIANGLRYSDASALESSMNDACRGSAASRPACPRVAHLPSEWVCIPQFTVSYLELAYDWHFHDIKSLHTFKLSRVWQGNLTSRPQGAQLPTDFPHVIPLRLLTIQ
jgi:hypothetical protein